MPVREASYPVVRLVVPGALAPRVEASDSRGDRFYTRDQ